MSTTRNKLFFSLVSFFNYSLILLSLVSLPKVKSESVINFIIKCQGCTNNFINNGDKWPPVFNGLFSNINSVKVGGDGISFSYQYFKIYDGDSNIVVKFNYDIESYAQMFEGIAQVFEEITLIEFNTKKASSMRRMFYGTSFKKITIQNVDSSLVADMSQMFENC